MAEISIQLDDTILKVLEAKASRRNLSIADWIKERIDDGLNQEWPENYFTVFGSLNDEDLEEASEIPFSQDSHREGL